jgi:hypothetical protein
MLPIGALLVGSFLKSSTLETQLRLKITSWTFPEKVDTELSYTKSLLILHWTLVP